MKLAKRISSNLSDRYSADCAEDQDALTLSATARLISNNGIITYHLDDDRSGNPPMTPTATKKLGKLYRYYVSTDVIKNRTTEDDSAGDQAPTRLPAGMVEGAIVTEVRRILLTPEVVTQVLAALKRDQVSEAEAIAALHDFNTLGAQLFPLEQARIIQLLVRRVTVTAAGLEVDIHREGVAGVIREMIAPRDMKAAE